jgi:hypothetical protein
MVPARSLDAVPLPSLLAPPLLLHAASIALAARIVQER